MEITKLLTNEKALELAEKLLQNDKDIRNKLDTDKADLIYVQDNLKSLDHDISELSSVTNNALESIDRDMIREQGRVNTELDKKVDKVDGKGLSTNDLTDELKSNYDKAVTDNHVHSNKSVIDTITAEKVSNWDNKSEFDGNYSSLQGIPEDIATETYVDGKVAVKANTTDLSNVNTTLSSRIKIIEDDYVKEADIPVNVSELTNDSNYQTADDVSAILTTALEPYAKSAEVTTEISTEISKVIADAPEPFNTLKKMSDWISNHETDVSAMNSTIQENKNNIVALENSKVDKIEGKGLSTNDYTTDEKTKLEGLSNYDDSAIKNTIDQNTKNIATKLDKNQGTSNAGKITGINGSGDIVPMFPQGITYNEETQCLEYGVDEKLNLNAGIQLDDTLSKSGYAADASKVGELKGELDKKITSPKNSNGTISNGISGQILQTNGDGTTQWVDKTPTVPDWAKQPEKPSYTALEVGADATGTAESKVSDHNVSDTAHNDIRLLIEGLTTRLNALADSDDTTLDQMGEVVAYIKSNRSMISSITTDKVNVTSIVNDLTTNVANKPLSAAQGVALKALIDEMNVPASTTADNGKVLSVVDGAPSWTTTSSEQAAISAANAERSATIAQECAQAMAGTFDFTGYLRYQVVDAAPETYEKGVLYLVTNS